MEVINKKLLAAAVLATLPLSAFATNGYFQHGYGIIAQGMGGAATAMTKDAMGGANNPASMVWVGNRIDLGFTVFSPKREAERRGNAMGLNGSSESGKDYFLLPGFGYNRLVNDKISLGVTVYGNGGMDTHYASGTLFGGNANLLAGQGRLGVNLEQIVIAPTVSFKLSEYHSIGVSPLLTYQRFKAYGLSAFKGMSENPDYVTDKGRDDSTGVGVRIGWLSKINDSVSLGASYSPQTRMSKFNDYKGLFAQQGRFDLPENYSLGLAVAVTDTLSFAFDYQRINYSNVRAVGNASSILAPLGSDNGPGFGWHDINIYKAGFEYAVDPQLTLRAGYSHSDNPIHADDVTFNILAPGVIEDHATLGASWSYADNSELSVAYTHAFSNSVSGPSIFGGTETIKMYHNSVGISYGLRF
ncbi:outer membrane protein transport protein [Dasania marina]|uniref:OmpP1/FadL family transporter n=1 Tax=Dasania marina TaxID=471499 RepID=UPI0030DD206E